MLISEAYARKVWTIQERRSALAKALLGKQDYILPVRFDSTELPGMLPTTHYLDYDRKGVQGVFAAVMQKLGKSPAGIQNLPSQSVAPAKSQLSLSKSSYVLLVAQELNTILFVPVLKEKWGTQRVELTVQPDDPNDGSALNRFGKMSAKLSVTYDHFYGNYKVADTTRISGGGNEQWEILLEPSRDQSYRDYHESPPLDRAKVLVNRLLFNKDVFNENTRDMQAIFREAADTAFSGGAIKSSPLPALFQTFGTDPKRFLEIAWIHLVFYLRSQNIVEDIRKLDLTLKGKTLEIDFYGVMKQHYSNRPADEIKVRGVCDLTES